MTPPERWSALHHGIDPATVPGLLPWLRVLWWLARPLARLRVPPTAVTVAGVGFAAAAWVLAPVAPGIAASAVIVAVVCDGLDGALAVVAQRATRSGAWADAVADRVCDGLFCLLLWPLGAPLWLALAAAALAVSVDLARRVLRRPAVITVAERPTWAICAVLGCVSARVTSADWPQYVCGLVAVGLGLLALVQLVATAASTDGSTLP